MEINSKYFSSLNVLYIHLRDKTTNIIRIFIVYFDNTYESES